VEDDSELEDASDCVIDGDSELEVATDRVIEGVL
jgi:hypothetical protein